MANNLILAISFGFKLNSNLNINLVSFSVLNMNILFFVFAWFCTFFIAFIHRYLQVQNYITDIRLQLRN